MDCLNCDNDRHDRTEYITPDYTEKELKKLLADKRRKKLAEARKEKYNNKIYKQIKALKKKLK